MGKKVKPDYSLIPLTISLSYDVSYMLGNQVSSIGKEVTLPGAAGPGSFWNTLNGKTGFTKEVVNNDGDITNILAITPSSNVALPYMIKLIKSGSKVSDFEDFIEIHPTTDGIFKLTEYFFLLLL